MSTEEAQTGADVDMKDEAGVAGYSLLRNEDAVMAPFLVPRGTVQTDVAARLF